MRETSIRTDVAIIGAGPAGLLLGQLLQRAGIASVVVEDRSRAHVEGRIRAGVLEQGSVELLEQAGVGARLHRQGLVHHGIELLFDGRRHRIDLSALTGGRAITVYGQHEVVRDLIEARLDAGAPLFFEAADVSLHGIDGSAPAVSFTSGGVPHVLQCGFITGCDGSHGVSRLAMPAGAVRVFERSYPFAWLGILARAAPASTELIYASHARGFALASMRSPEITRLYLQCRPDEDLADWPEARIWEELHTRLETGDGRHLNEGEVLQTGITPMRSLVTEPMQHGRLFLAGDAAHIVPPTGAKGMNLAMADVRNLAHALVAHYQHGRDDLLAGYSAACLQRVWRAEHFSWWLTSLLHRFDDHTPFMQRLQHAELEYVCTSEAAARALAENYVGLPFAPLPA